MLISRRAARKDKESVVCESLGWQLRVMAADISLVLWYPEDAPGCNNQVTLVSLEHIVSTRQCTCLPLTYKLGRH